MKMNIHKKQKFRRKYSFSKESSFMAIERKIFPVHNQRTGRRWMNRSWGELIGAN